MHKLALGTSALIAFGVVCYANHGRNGRRKKRRRSAVAPVIRLSNEAAQVVTSEAAEVVANEAAQVVTAPKLTHVPPGEISGSISGVIVDEQGIRIHDWGRWIRFAQKALRQAIALGIFRPEAVLVHIMRNAYPQRTWPPPPNSILVIDWNGMLAVLSSQLDPDPVPETRPLLRVVR